MPSTGTRSRKVTTDVYQEVTDRVIAALEAGTVPWEKPWTPRTGRPVSLSTGNPYRGVNVLLLGLTAMEAGYSSPFYGTYKQISELGGQVRKGEKSTQVIFFKQYQVADADARARGEDKTKTVPVLRAYRLFNAEQADGLPERFYPEPLPEPEPIAQPHEVLYGYVNAQKLKLRHVEGDRAFYRWDIDTITLPTRGQFSDPAMYYSTAFHEATHSTGHEKRLRRPGISEFDHFGSAKYAKEELVAQMGSAVLCVETGIETEGMFSASAAYIANWLGALQDDRKLVVSAAAQAERAVALITEPTRPAEESEPEAELATAAA